VRPISRTIWHIAFDLLADVKGAEHSGGKFFSMDAFKPPCLRLQSLLEGVVHFVTWSTLFVVLIFVFLFNSLGTGFPTGFSRCYHVNTKGK